ncbi:hypothetical protein [Streptomyces sp. NBC_01367]|uniref:hypothetical protein n=1 Tax=Streptomyces sp. NBC_01367 TaxID=2903841 RepID=UPI0032558853
MSRRSAMSSTTVRPPAPGRRLPVVERSWELLGEAGRALARGASVFPGTAARGTVERDPEPVAYDRAREREVAGRHRPPVRDRRPATGDRRPATGTEGTVVGVGLAGRFSGRALRAGSSGGVFGRASVTPRPTCGKAWDAVASKEMGTWFPSPLGWG